MQLRLTERTPDLTLEQLGLLLPVPKPCTDKAQSYTTAMFDAPPAAAVLVEETSSGPLLFAETLGCSACSGFAATAAGAGKITLASRTISSTVSSCCHRHRFVAAISDCCTKADYGNTDVLLGGRLANQPGTHSLMGPSRPATGFRETLSVYGVLQTGWNDFCVAIRSLHRTMIEGRSSVPSD